MDDDNRIVQSGALGGISIDAVASEATEAPQPPQGSGSSQYQNEPFTLDDRFVVFLSNAYTKPFAPDIPVAEDHSIEVEDKLGDLKSLVEVLGSDFFSLDEIESRKTSAGNARYLIGKLALQGKILQADFRKSLASFLGSEEEADFLISTDFGQALGLDDETAEIDLGNEELQSYFPFLNQVQSLEQRYVIPSDPHVLLLSVPVEYRRFLSLCLDQARGTDMGNNLDATSPFTTDDNEVGFDPHGYECNTIWKYGINWKIFNEMLKVEPLVPLKTLVKVATQYQEREFKQYVDLLNDLQSMFANIQTN